MLPWGEYLIFNTALYHTEPFLAGRSASDCVLAYYPSPYAVVLIGIFPLKLCLHTF